jgi:hypothetical protein
MVINKRELMKSIEAVVDKDIFHMAKKAFDLLLDQNVCPGLDNI